MLKDFKVYSEMLKDFKYLGLMKEFHRKMAHDMKLKKTISIKYSLI